MNKCITKEVYTDRLDLRIPTIDEQHELWKILIIEDVNKYYFPTPDRIFTKNNLSKDKIEDLKEARKIFMNQFLDWERQKPFYEKKIELIKAQDNSQKYTWSIFLKGTNTVIGQITCQPKDNEPENIRDIGWFISPDFQGHGYATEAALAIVDYMFNEVGITDIQTGAAEINPASWKIMEKLGFEFVGKEKSTYYKGNEILLCKKYHGTKELFLNRNNKD